MHYTSTQPGHGVGPGSLLSKRGRGVVDWERLRARDDLKRNVDVRRLLVDCGRVQALAHVDPESCLMESRGGWVHGRPLGGAKHGRAAGKVLLGVQASERDIKLLDEAQYDNGTEQGIVVYHIVGPQPLDKQTQAVSVRLLGRLDVLAMLGGEGHHGVQQDGIVLDEDGDDQRELPCSIGAVQPATEVLGEVMDQLGFVTRQSDGLDRGPPRSLEQRRRSMELLGEIDVASAGWAGDNRQT